MNTPLSTQQAMRYSRQILLAGFDLDKQEILTNSRALVIGVGGLGCAASQYLVTSGMGKVTLVDDDKVETTNLQRQVLHAESHVGMSKCASALASLSQLNSDTLITTFEERLSDEQLSNMLPDYDVVLDCSDNLETRNQLNRLCYQSMTPLVSGAAIRMEGQLITVVPKDNSACYACVSRLFGEQQLSCVESGVMSPIVGIIGASQALEAIKVVTGYGEIAVNRLQLFDGMTMQWQNISLNKNVNCSICN